MMQSHFGVLSWLHIGDLRITRAGGSNHLDLRRVAAPTVDLSPDSLEFAVLPGDHDFKARSRKGVLSTQLGPHRNGRRW